jgi:hypothetical protein
MDWITDRLPTERDADGYGDVRVPRCPGESPGAFSPCQHYSCVVPGQPWWSHSAAPTPEPAPKPAPDPTPAPTERRIVQVAHSINNQYNNQTVIAACNDGTAWSTWGIGDRPWTPWQQLPPIPQPEPQS